MVDVRDSTREGGGWFLSFTRSFNDWEMEEVERFLHMIHFKKVIPSLEDKMIMKESKASGFSAKGLYRLLDQAPIVPFPFRLFWSSFGPTKVAFFFLLERPLGVRC